MSQQDEMVVLMNEERISEDPPDPRKGRLFFEGPFDDDFWDKVDSLYREQDKPWSEALAEAHYDRVVKSAQEAGIDPAMYLMINVVDQFWNVERPKEESMQLFPAYKKQVTRVLRLVLDKEQESAGGPEKSQYIYHMEPDTDDVCYTVLHYAARQNLEEVVEIMLEKYPGLQNVQTDGLTPEKYPVEFALEKKDDGIDRDETAALLLTSMFNERVRSLFQYSPTFKLRVSFPELVRRPEMKRTVSEVLNAMINPDWPYVLVRDGKEEDLEKLWQTDPNLPIRYHFFYQILEQDGNGRAPKVQDKESGTLKEDPEFNHRSISGLKSLVYGPMGKFAVKHPVVRQLIDFKWNTYGNKIIWFYSGLYFLFLTLLTVSLLLACYSKDAAKYDNKSVDILRGFCELGVLAFSIAYFLDELDQMERERGRYANDVFNLLDLIGLFLIFIIVPLRFLTVSFHWYAASLAFIVNYIRGSKFLFAWQDYGVYARVLVTIIKQDLKIFLTIYAIVFLGFTGGVFLAMKGANNLGKVSGLPGIILRGVRALTEGKEFADDYDGFNWFVVVVILLHMLIVLVVLINLFIAQLSNRYEVAAEQASVEYDIDKIMLVCRVENSRFRSLNLRRKFYKDGDFITDINKIQDYVSVWNETVTTFGLKDKYKFLADAQEAWTKKTK